LKFKEKLLYNGYASVYIRKIVSYGSGTVELIYFSDSLSTVVIYCTCSSTVLRYSTSIRQFVNCC